ncbi:hypothetical protein [Propylenella binzhouense]|uniref:Uncharacterized protein n=1 Tax=Propylenella binzhouense TaxID=2555902 RepID=A0A964T2D0_9HYPH|nr:hypothetical protein [Propylenella binzhouense]MYZ47019.1 hypothetical protein [Propylenella binzhouense]
MLERTRPIPSDFEVTRVVAEGRPPALRIAAIGGPEGDGWTLSAEAAVAMAETGACRFWALVGGRRIRVEVGRDACGEKRLGPGELASLAATVRNSG